MSAERLDLSRLLAADMRKHLSEADMMQLLRQCGGVIVGDGQEWHVKVGGGQCTDASRTRVLNRALDLIATRPDLWPQGPPIARMRGPEQPP